MSKKNLAQRVLILASKTGAGHMSNALSLQAWIQHYYPNTTVEICDALSHSPKFFGRDPISLAYYIMSVHLPWLWKYFVNAVYKKGVDALDKAVVFVAPLMGKKVVIKKILSFKPDMMLATYGPFVYPVKKFLNEHGVTTPIKMVITDIFSAPQYWMTKGANAYYVMSEEAQKNVKDALPNKPIYLMPPLLHPKFFGPEIKKKSKKKNILVLAGGEGVHKLNAIVAKLAQDRSVTITVVCGKDPIGRRLLQQEKKLYKWSHVEIHGFTNSIETLLQQSDVVITKAGPATIFEALRYKKPIICYHYVYGTEQENIDFLIKNNYGIYEPDIDLIPHHVNAIFSEKIKLQTRVIRPLYSQAITSMLTLSEKTDGPLAP